MKILFLNLILMAYSFSTFATHTFESKYDFSKTSKNIENFISKKGLKLFKTINHSENASSAKLKLLNNKVYIIGNPNVGTPLMQVKPSIGIDLPVKIHLYSDANDKAYVSYNTPDYLSKRHGIPSDHPSFKKMRKLLGALKSKLKQ